MIKNKVEKSGNENIDKKANKNHEKIKEIINIILVIIWMIIVFLFSSEIGLDSSNTSGETIKHVLTTLKKDWNPLELENTVESIQPYARKLAHFTLYTIGGFFIYNFNKNNKKVKQIKEENSYLNGITISLFFGMLYAITDEIHQAFVPGRDGRILDVCIDSFGVLFGIYICRIKDKFLKK